MPILATDNQGIFTSNSESDQAFILGLVSHWPLSASKEFEGTDLVTNGDFAAGDVNWTKSGWTITSESATSADGTEPNDLSQNIGAMSDRLYKVTWTGDWPFASDKILTPFIGTVAGASQSDPGSGPFTFIDYIRGDGDTLKFTTTGLNGEVILDDVSVVEITQLDVGSDNNFDGTPQVGPLVYQEDRFGVAATALDFDGVADSVNIGDEPEFSFGNGTTDSPFTFAAHVFLDDATLFVIVAKDSGAGGKEYAFLIDGIDVLLVVLTDDSTGDSIGRKKSAAITAEGVWQHLAFTYSGSGVASGIKIYQVGVQVDDADNNSGVAYTAMEPLGANLMIGSLEASSLFSEGRIQDVRLYNRELSSLEIAILAAN